MRLQIFSLISLESLLKKHSSQPSLSTTFNTISEPTGNSFTILISHYVTLNNLVN